MREASRRLLTEPAVFGKELDFILRPTELT
jgi:hypothetical protein